MSVRLKAYWGLFTLTLGVYLTMIFWSLRKITEAAGGLAPFDLRPSGYDSEEAHAFLTALDPAAVTFYLEVQHRLDLAYPAFLAAVLAIPIFHFIPEKRVVMRYSLAAVPVIGAIFDYLENAAVGVMLELGAGPELVAQASRWTVLKSTFTTIAALVLLVILLVHFWRRWKSRRNV